jgi:hypothetical protein
MGKEIQNTNQTITNSFIKGLNKDSDPSYVQEGMWTHARNVSNNTFEGDLGTLSNESSNYLCLTTGATMPTTGPIAVTEIKIIGAIQLFSDKWIIFTAGHNVNGRPVMSEIGLFEEERCLYRPIVQDACLAFDKRYLISGASREKEDCTWQVYWADGLNPDRYLNVGDPQTWPTPDYNWIGGGLSTMNYYSNGVDTDFLWPGVEWFEICTDTTTGCTQVSPGVWSPDCPLSINACISCKPINSLNCDKIRLARLMETPCLNLTLGQSGGTLRNGTYFATIAYSIKGQKVTDYFSQSNNQFVWHPDDFQGSLILEVNADSKNFDEFILVIVQNINQGTVAKQIGIYSSRTTVIALDQIKEDLISVPLQFIPIQTPIFEKCDQIAEVNNYLLRVGPTSKFDFNYQPLANLIKAKWASVQYPSDYYVQGGNKGSYLRDEVYAFFIRWVYDTGDKSASYHIPGRAPSSGETAGSTDINALTTDDRYFEVFDTATQDSSITVFPNSTFNPTLGKYLLPDGGIILRTGNMAYWESTEKYPDDRPDIYNASYNCWTGETIPSPVYDLCGQPIRHHKFPNNCLTNDTIHFSPDTTNNGDNILNIRLMGVYFENIIFPKDNEGNDIPGIVGYEILRGSREGNKSIIAKGMLNNFRTYNLTGNAGVSPSSNTIKKGLYANYPFNTIRPFYNTNNPSNHNYQYNDPYFRIPDPNNPTGNNVDDQQVPLDMMSFHSPDTMFRSPLLTTTELKVYGYLRGRTSQQFIEPNQHPEFKLLADAVLFPLFLAGMLEAIISIRGRYTINAPTYTSPGFDLLAAGTSVPTQLSGSLTAQTFYNAPGIGYNPLIENYFNGGVGFLTDTLSSIVGLGTPALNLIDGQHNFNMSSIVALGGASFGAGNYSQSMSDNAYLGPLAALGGINQLLYYFSEGADVAQKLLLSVTPYRQYALQMISHGFYNNMIGNATGDTFRFKLDDSFYIRDNFQQVPYYQDTTGNAFNYTINNLKRSDTVVLRTKSGPYLNPAFPNGLNTGPKYITDNFGRFIDQSLTTLGTIQQYGLIDPSTLFINIEAPDFENTDIPFSLPIASHYAGIKVRLRNQYGQLPSVKQIVISPCEQKLSDYPNYINNAITSIVCDPPNQLRLNSVRRTPLFFGGDTYINRYTEKNTMFMFYDWLFGQPDGFEYNYNLRKMIPNPRFWVNSAQYDISNLAPGNFSNPTPGTGALPTRFYRLDFKNYDYTSDPIQVNYPGLFSAKESKFYLAVSSVRDFYVESDVLVDFRDMGDYEWDKNYDANRYTDLVSMFNIDPENITKGNTYRYDYSLSISKLYNQYFSQGNLQSRYYDPEIAKLCYTYYPDRIYYSLQQQDESFKDSWFVYLANNYREFKSQVSGVKSINKSGLFITFKNDSPQMFQGVDTLQTDLGTKITIGDGGLFSQPGQSVSNADKAYEYGSSQNRLSIANTPAGLFYVSQNQSKILGYGEGLKEISQVGLKWWFSLFLRYKLTEHFPNYPWQDNPVAGIGIQSVYDNLNSVLYFAKKDYDLRPEYINPETGAPLIEYIPLVTVGKTRIYETTLRKGEGDFFVIKNPDGSVNMNNRYRLEENLLFKNASWTVSYDPKNEFWISFHDWHPDLVIPTKRTFLTTKNNTGWTHNYSCNEFCNYYGIDYPFEIELPIITGQTVTTLKSMEYILECYKRSDNCVDQFQVLDFNFDKAVVFNAEQVSGYLNLNIFPKNNITLSLQYPKANNSIIVEPNLPASVGFDILFSKEENKYRFNQFWDITKDRGEFPIGSTYPPVGPLIPGTTQLLGNYNQEYLWNTEPNGYVKILNPNNLDVNKSLLQRKKFRHYLNLLHLRKDVSGNVNMLIKLINSKNQISLR